MRIPFQFLGGALIAAGLGCFGCVRVADPLPVEGAQMASGSTLSSVRFSLGQRAFEPGDSIVIQQVFASSPRFAVGDTVVVRGRYELASQADATLALYVTGHGAGPQRTSPTQRVRVTKGAGEFELACAIANAGALHVSFYPGAGGSVFGGVYFSPTTR